MRLAVVFSLLFAVTRSSCKYWFRWFVCGDNDEDEDIQDDPIESVQEEEELSSEILRESLIQFAKHKISKPPVLPPMFQDMAFNGFSNLVPGDHANFRDMPGLSVDMTQEEFYKYEASLVTSEQYPMVTVLIRDLSAPSTSLRNYFFSQVRLNVTLWRLNDEIHHNMRLTRLELIPQDLKEEDEEGEDVISERIQLIHEALDSAYSISLGSIIDTVAFWMDKQTNVKKVRDKINLE